MILRRTNSLIFQLILIVGPIVLFISPDAPIAQETSMGVELREWRSMLYTSRSREAVKKFLELDDPRASSPLYRLILAEEKAAVRRLYLRVFAKIIEH